MYFTLPDGNKIYYEIRGDEAASSTIVFLNGLTQNTGSWLGVTQGLERDLRIVLMDLLFQGKSDQPDEYLTYDAHADAVAALIRRVSAAPVWLAGLSYGSGVAQHVAVRHSEIVKGIVLMSTFARATPLFTAMGESWKLAVKMGGYAHLIDVMLPTVLGASYYENPLIPVDTLKALRAGNDLNAHQILKLMQGTEARGDYRHRLPEIQLPALVMHGKEDLLIPAPIGREVAELIPGAEWQLLDRVGHTLNLEAIPQSAAAIRQFISNRA